MTTMLDALCAEYKQLRDDPRRKVRRYQLLAEEQRVLAEQSKDLVCAFIRAQIAEDYMRLAKGAQQIENSIAFLRTLHVDRRATRAAE